MKEKSTLQYLDSPASVDAKVLALSMVIAATVSDMATKIGIDPSQVTVTLDVGGDSIRFRVQGGS